MHKNLQFTTGLGGGVVDSKKQQFRWVKSEKNPKAQSQRDSELIPLGEVPCGG